ncbi:MAG TPA: DUF2202 domain-containing protein [Anaerolineales bacterium]|nr:DUF2202 domain-containing protein [Anaerolineales bacterium]
MFKYSKKILAGLLAFVTVLAVGSNFVPAKAAAPIVLDQENTSITTGLSEEEIAGLLFMREEEKLARDVYNQLYTIWGQPIFKNIAASEQTHMDQIKILLDRYGLTDPALAPGQFADPTLQALYNQLLAQGSLSLADALNVGALIEKTDIVDLQAHVAQTDQADIQLVYNNLMNASYNHLAAFTGTQSQGGNGKGRGNSPRH